MNQSQELQSPKQSSSVTELRAVTRTRLSRAHRRRQAMRWRFATVPFALMATLAMTAPATAAPQPHEFLLATGPFEAGILLSGPPDLTDRYVPPFTVGLAMGDGPIPES